MRLTAIIMYQGLRIAMFLLGAAFLFVGGNMLAHQNEAWLYMIGNGLILIAIPLLFSGK